MNAVTSIPGPLVDEPRSSQPDRPAAAPAIRLESVSNAYALPSGAPLQAVREVSLEVARGDIFGLVGTSGAGKSTLLRLINRLEEPDSGRVFVGPHEITSLGRASPR